ncbi:hypothetical protein SNOG_12594 [Parastagonospora nodorum SN15]|uniref:Uncharacterized protein n=1 Tax=Phaeosphaeria nodorum (strain SN15 / ATCC MYA-4574 / FGSC 10173) TaxID=321614 RepID=Q0U6M0_PHANO|nr:hypothetical protein SNOG_12594 [Parastagonospora nodorum SN15]EAT79892.1 hypothetical protein SNOG_12594 [Parastagonospora nodorum SN15]
MIMKLYRSASLHRLLDIAFQTPPSPPPPPPPSAHPPPSPVLPSRPPELAVDVLFLAHRTCKTDPLLGDTAFDSHQYR